MYAIILPKYTIFGQYVCQYLANIAVLSNFCSRYTCIEPHFKHVSI